ncbi:MAG TPA: hypothetical protein VGJ37_11340 [Pyrinomonadaceae bacterium]|jgi:hypothetical protein
MANEQLQWTAPEPFWPNAAATSDAAARRATLRRPAILRFASDTFMDDFLAQLARDPGRLPDYAAQPETWRGPATTPVLPKQLPSFARALSRKALAKQKQNSLSIAPTQTPKPALAPLKLYQPGHQRFYLVTSSLVCGRAGLPDHAVNPGKQERVGFVIRRLLPQNYKEVSTDNRGVPIPLPAPDNSWDEYALVTTTAGSGWRKVKKSGTAEVLLEGEELLPMFPATYQQDDGHQRRVFGGLIPVGKRESYVGATLLPEAQATTGTGVSASAADAAVDPRMMPLWIQVTEPWKRLLETADRVRTLQATPPDPTLSGGDTMPASDLDKWITSAREQIQTGSWYILLDFTKYLAENFPKLWEVVRGAEPESFVTNSNEQKILTALKTTEMPAALITDLSTPAIYSGHVKSTFAQALKAIDAEDAESGLESVANAYVRNNPDPRWPKFLFPFADPTLAATDGPLPTSITISAIGGEKPIDTAFRKIDAFAKLIQDALPAQDAPPESSLPLVAQRPIDMRQAWFQLRCVYDRPECGPLDPPVVSAPTEPFQMANFFDPDAPARPVRIALPIDTSPAGLRKFDKNAAFVMSDMLCGQVNRMKGITLADLVLSVLPWPLHKDLSVPDAGPCSSGGLQVGMICSLSIPIITICALLLLMIIVFLLDFIFRWIPFFLICFPLPGLSSGKK